MNALSDAGTVGIIVVAVILILRELPPLVKTVAARTNGKNGHDSTPTRRAADIRLETIARQVGEMHRMHDVRDSDGLPLWYVPRSLEKAVRELIEVNRNLAEEVRALARMRAP